MSWLDTLESIRKKDFTTVSETDRDAAARDVVNMASYGCAVVAVSPIPFSDAVISLPLQSAMVMTVGHIYGRKVTQADAKSLVLELGAVAGIGLVARQGIKALLPVVGALLTVPAAFAMNWAIGRATMEYFKYPNLPKEQLKKIFETAKEEGSKLFSLERLNAFRRSTAAGESTPQKKLSRTEKLVREELHARFAKHPDLCSAINGFFHLDLTGDEAGQWTIDLTHAEKLVTDGLTGTPALTMRCQAEVLRGMLAGRKDPQLAVLSGDLELIPLEVQRVEALFK